MIKPPLDVNAAARLSNGLRLRDIICVGLEAKHLVPESGVADAALGWEMPPLQVFWELDDAGLKVIVPFTLFIEAHANGGNGDKKTRLAEIGVGLRLEYEVKKGESWSDEDLPHYAGITSYLHAWPYFRADVQLLSTKLGYPPLVLPVIVSGHPAKQVSVTRLSEVKTPPPLPRRPKPKKKASK